MTEIIVVRHGQAQIGAKDEAGYDRLSDLGYQQAAWLGEYWKEWADFDRVITGTMRRQVETGRSMALNNASYSKDSRLNEMDYFGLARVLKDSHGLVTPPSQECLQSHVRQVLTMWACAQVGDDLESYDAFRSRILAAVREIAAQDGRSVIVSSTGVIATLMAEALDLDIARKTDVFLKIVHTSVHRFEITGDEVRLLQFCATPHLDAPERLVARTYI